MTTAENRVALVTGASRGIGARIATALAHRGWDLTLSARRPESLQEFAENLAEKTGRRVLAVPADMSDEDAVSELAGRHDESFDRLDALVLNAGMGAIGPFSDFPLRKLDKLFTVNVRSAYQLVQQLLPTLRETGTRSTTGARVIAMASMAGVSAEPLNSAYGATKAALISLCETLTVEEHAHGVSGVAVCPGYVATDMTASRDDVDADTMITADDVADQTVAVTQLSRTVVIPRLLLTRPGPNLWHA
ncbi:SDR family NAD(P)-dependent oxidoreductase [Rhodococcus sp. LB1]|uniref:SDR family NAD(P)-dependent oxidoreductase n=1 Tax=Rhodococcus sp. LB1 TaxID=1807499 RepID=UPI00077AF76E|nr:SDR family oxidoreductase [Rhodococcus sp. LB1]KXX59527.1 short-chain dehydrogenase [Rhodococcus sp. LB1]